jgi:hypothetical protein
MRFEVLLALVSVATLTAAAWLAHTLRRRERPAPYVLHYARRGSSPVLPRLYEDEEQSASRSAVIDTVSPECEADEPTLPTPTFALTAGASSNAGPRATNEDAVLALAHEGLFAIADGMGGHKAGDVASHVALDRLRCEVDRVRSGAWSPPSKPRIGRCNAKREGAVSWETWARRSWPSRSCLAARRW